LELVLPDDPGKLPMECCNPQLAALRSHKRQELLTASKMGLQAVKERVENSTAMRNTFHTPGAAFDA
jgi:hypothetical protein